MFSRISTLCFLVEVLPTSLSDPTFSEASDYSSSQFDWAHYSYQMNSSLVDGVPADLLSLIPNVNSPDYGTYSQCELPRGSGIMSGVCVQSLSQTDLPFCGEYIDYPVCVPGRNLNWEAWNWTVKDSVVGAQVNEVISARRAAEELSLANNGSSTDYLSIRFYGNDPCTAMYKRIVCYYNFPRCDDAAPGSSSIFPICTERCLDFFTACKYGSEFAASVCQVEGSHWPLSNDTDTAGIDSNSASIILQTHSVGSCTGSS